MRLSIALRTALAIAFFWLHTGFASSQAGSNSQIVIVTEDGAKPAPLTKNGTPKNSKDTLFLRSAVKEVPLAPSPQEKKKLLKTSSAAAQSNSKQPTPKPSNPAQRNAGAKKDETIKITKRSQQVSNDDLDEYSDIAKIADPAEPINRGTFWLNHQLYNYVLRPVSKAYEFILPPPARQAVRNVFDNAEYPVRVVNHALQFQFKRADLETRKFLVNSVAGVGGILKVSDKIPALSNVPSADTAQTLAKWGIGHGAYVVLPVLGPRSVRDTVGMAGDYALNPISWLSYGGLGGATTLAVSGPSAARNMNERIRIYDSATKNAIDPYIAVRTGYIQYRDQAASK